MNYTQNEKLLQVGEEKIIVGIDVGSEKHYARTFDWRGMEYSKKAYVFTNDAEGFSGFLEWISVGNRYFGYGADRTLLVRSR